MKPATRHLTNVSIEHGSFGDKLDQTVRHPFMELHLSFECEGKHHTLEPLVMTPDQARTLAMLLLAQADRAQTPDRTPPTQSH